MRIKLTYETEVIDKEIDSTKIIYRYEISRRVLNMKTITFENISTNEIGTVLEDLIPKVDLVNSLKSIEVYQGDRLIKSSINIVSVMYDVTNQGYASNGQGHVAGAIAVPTLRETFTIEIK